MDGGGQRWHHSRKSGTAGPQCDQMLEFQAGMHLPDVTIVLKKSGNALFAIPRHVCNEFIRLHHSNLGNALSSPKCTASYNLVSQI